MKKETLKKLKNGLPHMLNGASQAAAYISTISMTVILVNCAVIMTRISKSKSFEETAPSEES